MKTGFLENIVYKSNVHSKSRKNMIVLMRLDALGDFVLWLDAAKEYKKKYPKVKIVLICKNINEPLARTIPYFDYVIGIDLEKIKEDCKYFWSIYLKMKALRGAYLVQSVYSRTNAMDFIASMIPAYKKISISTDGVNMAGKTGISDWIYDSIVNISGVKEHELIKNARFLRKLGFHEFKAGLPELPEYSCRKETKIEEPYYVIVLGTSHYAKSWKVDGFCRVAQYIYEKYHMTCCMLGVEQDASLGRQFSTKCQNIPLKNLIGETTIPEYVQIIREAEFIVSGDTSAVHIAAAVKTKSIIIGGGWHFKRFLPYQTESGGNQYFPTVVYQHMDCYGCDNKRITACCKRDTAHLGKWSCILAVTPEMVIKRIEEMRQI